MEKAAVEPHARYGCPKMIGEDWSTARTPIEQGDNESSDTCIVSKGIEPGDKKDDANTRQNPPEKRIHSILLWRELKSHPSEFRTWFFALRKRDNTPISAKNSHISNLGAQR
jgi:hypothetical protein